jgi:hypothetical protein
MIWYPSGRSSKPKKKKLHPIHDHVMYIELRYESWKEFFTSTNQNFRYHNSHMKYLKIDYCNHITSPKRLKLVAAYCGLPNWQHLLLHSTTKYNRLSCNTLTEGQLDLM